MSRPKQFDEDDVLRKAMIIFWEKGYHNASIQDLVIGLEINRGSIYDTFGGKKKLYIAAFNLYTRTNLDYLKSLISTSRSVKGTLKDFFQMVVMTDYQEKEKKGCFVANTMTELLPGDSDFEVLLTSYKKKVEKIFVQILSLGVKSGELSKDIDVKAISNLMYTFLTGLRVVGKTSPIRKESYNSIDAMLSILN